MVWGIMLAWAIVAAILIFDNQELLNELPVWRGVLITVLLCLLAPAFFLSDFGELLLDAIAGEDREE